MVRGVLFDKDGTLFDFQRSWSGWAEDVLIDLSDGSPDTFSSLAALISYNIDKKSFSPDSLAIAGTLSEVAEALALGLPGCDPSCWKNRLVRAAEEGRPWCLRCPRANFFGGIAWARSIFLGRRDGTMTKERPEIQLGSLLGNY